MTTLEAFEILGEGDAKRGIAFVKTMAQCLDRMQDLLSEVDIPYENSYEDFIISADFSFRKNYGERLPLNELHPSILHDRLKD